jgi:HEAT repeat protein
MNTSNLETLLAMVQSGDPDQQHEALCAFIDLGDASVISSILPLVSSPDAWIRRLSAEALDELGSASDERIEPALLPLLTDPDSMVRNAAAEAFCLFGTPAAIEPLKRLLHADPDWVVRASAAEALGNIGDPSVLGDLEQALEDEYPAVQAYAAYALGLLAPPTYVPLLEQTIIKSSDLPVKGELIVATYRLGAPDGLRRVLKLIEMGDGDNAWRVLNEVQNLTEHHIPASLGTDAPSLRLALLALAQRNPLCQGQVEQILENLAKLEQAE